MTRARWAILTSLGALAAALAGCGSGSNPIERQQLDRSRESWAQLRQTGDSYRYVDLVSSFTGFRTETTIEVRGDAVVRRSLVRKDGDGVVVSSWTEEGTALGSHADGKPPLVMEGVYDYCEDTVLSRSPAENLITLTFRADGLLSVCAYAPRGCVDDCSVGYDLESIDLLD